ncbi:metallophosphoesterase [Candidatus Woesearchaeota archaeon]|nr:metallophosphoesterase [Candidatus Woesearchaeota archaeon]
MKLLAFTDMHGSMRAYRKIKKISRLRHPDVLVCAGDLTIFENKLVFFLRELNKIGKPVVIVHGNHEEPGSFDVKLKNIHFIHKKYLIIGNILFLGYGGGGFSTVDNGFKKTGEKFNDIIVISMGSTAATGH